MPSRSQSWTRTSLIIPCRTGTFTAPSAATHRASQKIQASVLRVIGRQGWGAVGTSDRQRRVDTPLGHTGPLESGATVWTCRITPRPSGVIESVLPTASFIATTAKFTYTGQVTSKALQNKAIRHSTGKAAYSIPAYSDRQPGSSRTRQRAALLALTGTGCGVGHPR